MKNAIVTQEIDLSVIVEQLRRIFPQSTTEFLQAMALVGSAHQQWFSVLVVASEMHGPDAKRTIAASTRYQATSVDQLQKFGQRLKKLPGWYINMPSDERSELFNAFLERVNENDT